MRVIEQLVCDPPETIILEEAGIFTYVDETGEDVRATFFVRCAPKPDDEMQDERINADRQSALNEQLTDMWSKLAADGNQKIHFTNKMPDPFF